MKIGKLIVVAALLGATYVQDQQQVQAVKLTEGVSMMDFNGADEDEIMDKVFSKYSIEGKDHTGVKNGQKILMKSIISPMIRPILRFLQKCAV